MSGFSVIVAMQVLLVWSYCVEVGSWTCVMMVVRTCEDCTWLLRLSLVGAIVCLLRVPTSIGIFELLQS